MKGKAGFRGKEHTWQSGCNNRKLGSTKTPAAQPPKCPECTSQKVWRDGWRATDNGDVQRWICRNCGRRFSQNESETPSKPLKKRSRWSINNASAYNLDRQVCELLTEDSKNLTKVETQRKRAAGATKKLIEAEVRGRLVEFAWWMKKEGYADESIRTYISCLRTLHVRGANLNDPESVKDAMAKQSWSNNRKRIAINAYTLFLKKAGLHWEKPKCKVTRKIPFIPTEQELDALIAGCGKKTATFLQLLKETAMRSGEAKRLSWTDIDFEKRVITLNLPEKGGNPRIWKVSPKLIGMLNALPKKSLKVFGDGPITSLKGTFLKARKRLAAKLQNPRLIRISFHTFRHWKATMEYHKTKDPYHVKSYLGHKSLRSTEIYINVEHAIFEDVNDDFHVRVAKTAEEIKSLLEVGFEYVCQKEDLLFFRKRK